MMSESDRILRLTLFLNARVVRKAVLVVAVMLAVPAAVDYATVHGGSEISGVTTTPADRLTTTGERLNGSGTTGGADPTTNSTAGPTPTETVETPGKVAFTIDAHGPAQVTVLSRATGKVVFKRRAYDVYHDIDPSPTGAQTLMYVASDVVGGKRCPESLTDPCMINVIERINYSTGATERLYTRTVAYNGSSAIHDVDRVTEDRYLVADIQFDRVFIVNVTTGEEVWEWEVATAYDRSTGGLKGDWTHVNDVEVVGEDLYMVSLRNQDQVIFVDRKRGLLANRTLGAEDNYDIMYEQHNPDYIPRERGGPAIVVADSENNRVVEYQWKDGSWNRTWLWADETLQWPRDADRLPNGNTLITDTHGRRLIEVTPSGEIVWKRTVPRAYEAELLGTGDESTGGYSMVAIRAGNATNGSIAATADIDSSADAVQRALLDALPPLVFHGFLFLLPAWITPLSGALLLLDTILVALWGLGEGIRLAVLRVCSDDPTVDPTD